MPAGGVSWTRAIAEASAAAVSVNDSSAWPAPNPVA